MRNRYLGGNSESGVLLSPLKSVCSVVIEAMFVVYFPAFSTGTSLQTFSTILPEPLTLRT